MYGDFGFVHLSSDGGANWKQAYVHTNSQNPPDLSTPKQKVYQSIGLENTTSWQVIWQNPDAMLAGFSDIGMIRSTDAGKRWGFTQNGLSVNSVYRIVEDKANNLMYAASSGIHDMYQSTRLADAQLDANDNSGKIYYSTNVGSNWQVLQSFGHPVFWIANDPNQPSSLYASVIHYGGGGANMKGGIWHGSLNGTWTQLPAPPRTEGHPASIVVLNNGKVACSFSGRRNSSGQFTASSGVFLYDPATNTWSDRSHPDMYYWTKDLIIDPSDPSQNTWYAGVFSGWGGAPNGKGGLFKTMDQGLHWTKLTGTQFDRVTSLSFNPLNLQQAYLTTETQGLWVSNNMNAATPNWSLVESYPFRQPERVFFNPYKPSEMWVCSFGNGLKVAQTTTPVKELSTQAPTLLTYPNPLKDNVLQLEIVSSPFVEETPVSIIDPLGRVIWNGKFLPGELILHLDTQNWAQGMYQIHCVGKGQWFFKLSPF